MLACLLACIRLAFCADRRLRRRCSNAKGMIHFDPTQHTTPNKYPIERKGLENKSAQSKETVLRTPIFNRRQNTNKQRLSSSLFERAGLMPPQRKSCTSEIEESSKGSLTGDPEQFQRSSVRYLQMWTPIPSRDGPSERTISPEMRSPSGTIAVGTTACQLLVESVMQKE